jgi:hypothetical protein
LPFEVFFLAVGRDSAVTDRLFFFDNDFLGLDISSNPDKFADVVSAMVSWGADTRDESLF